MFPIPNPAETHALWQIQIFLFWTAEEEQNTTKNKNNSNTERRVFESCFHTTGRWDVDVGIFIFFARFFHTSQPKMAAFQFCSIFQFAPFSESIRDPEISEFNFQKLKLKYKQKLKELKNKKKNSLCIR